MANGFSASDEITVYVTSWPLVHWKLDEEPVEDVVPEGIGDSSYLDSTGEPAGRYPGELRNKGINGWIPEGGRYGGAVELTPGGHAEMDENFRIGVNTPFSAALWFKTDVFQTGTLIDRLPNSGSGTGWSLRIGADGSVVLSVGDDGRFVPKAATRVCSWLASTLSDMVG